METNLKRNAKKRSRDTKTRGQAADGKKKKRVKEPKMKLSNYEKTVRKFNLNQQLSSHGKTENKRITKGPLKVKSSREGLFLKARRSAVVRKRPLNDANEARKNEDINKIIDIGNDMLGVHRTTKGKERGNIFKRLDFPKSSDDEEEDKTVEESKLSVSDLLLKEAGIAKATRQTPKKKKLKPRLVSETSSNSSGESFERPKRRKKTKVTAEKSDIPAPKKLEEYLLRHFARSLSSEDDYHRRDSSPRPSTSARAFGGRMRLDEIASSSSSEGFSSKPEITDLEAFEDFVCDVDNAIANTECTLLTGPGILESALTSLRSLHRKKMEMHERNKMKKEADFGGKLVFKSEEMHDPVLSWALTGSSPAAEEESPGADPWNANFTPNIFTFPESPENSATSFLDHEGGVIDARKDLSPKIRSPSPCYKRRDMF